MQAEETPVRRLSQADENHAKMVPVRECYIWKSRWFWQPNVWRLDPPSPHGTLSQDMQCNAWREEWHSLVLYSISSLRMAKICRGGEMAVFPGWSVWKPQGYSQCHSRTHPSKAQPEWREHQQTSVSSQEQTETGSALLVPQFQGKAHKFFLLFCFAFGWGLVSRCEMFLSTSSYKGGGRDGESWSRGLKRKQECDPTKFRL